MRNESTAKEEIGKAGNYSHAETWQHKRAFDFCYHFNILKEIGIHWSIIF